MTDSRTKDLRVHNHSSAAEKAACRVCNPLETTVTNRDPLDEHIESNRALGNRHYPDALEIIRNRLQALERREATTLFTGTAWLIECSYQGQNVQYYFAPAMWCSNPNHARKFTSREEAEARSAEMQTIGQRQVVEHAWS